MKEYHISVRELVEFLSRSGSISNTIQESVSAIEGTRIHQAIQKKQPQNYISEVTLNYTHKLNENTIIVLQGRADGVIKDEMITIDEIKSTRQSLDDLQAIDDHQEHYDQARVYAFIYAKQHELTRICVQLTYYQIDSKTEKKFLKELSFSELETFFLNLMKDYEQFLSIMQTSHQKTKQSLHNLPFPYPNYRPGQKEMAISIYNTIYNKENCFLQAATGIGKTMSSIYPSLRALEKGLTSKIMYLTAKTITKEVALNSLQDLRNLGVYLRSVIITAKEKICFMDECICQKEFCPYALNHYHRINKALLDILENESNYTRECIEAYAMKHQVCPFEFSLDLFNFSDFSISDYNYAFDPKVALKRAFETKNDYILLVDEAHNLIDRARSMFSATLDRTIILICLESFEHKKGKLYRSIKKLDDYFNTLIQNEVFKQASPEIELIEQIEKIKNLAYPILPKIKIDDPLKKTLEDLYFMLLDCSRTFDLYNDDFITYLENQQLHFFCLNPKVPLRQTFNKVNSAILFSATLLPIHFFYELLGGKSPDKKFYFPSPFNPHHKCLLVAEDFKADYKHRQESLNLLISYIQKATTYKSGHYLIFFPSYAYLNLAFEKAKSYFKDIKLFKQDSLMNEQDKDKFLFEFKTELNTTKLFFCVLGGLFSEGLDFKGDQVIGVIIVSVGLPQLNPQRDYIKVHFDQENRGFEYAYVYPGFNKVLQAAGRLIRQEDDQGIILLLDERYLQKRYCTLYPQEWANIKKTNIMQIENQIKAFTKK